MAIRQIRMSKDEILYKKARNVEKLDDKTKELVQDMFDTMYKYDGIGLASPQVGVLKSIIVYDIDYVEDGKVKNGKVLYNPVITKSSKKMITTEEGCLSFPDFFGNVDRHETVEVEGFDKDFKKIKIKASGIESVVLQHEIDHLNGKVFTELAYDTYYGNNNDKK